MTDKKPTPKPIANSLVNHNDFRDAARETAARDPACIYLRDDHAQNVVALRLCDEGAGPQGHLVQTSRSLQLTMAFTPAEMRELAEAFQRGADQLDAHEVRYREAHSPPTPEWSEANPTAYAALDVNAALEAAGPPLLRICSWCGEVYVATRAGTLVCTHCGVRNITVGGRTAEPPAPELREYVVRFNGGLDPDTYREVIEAASPQAAAREWGQRRCAEWTYCNNILKNNGQMLEVYVHTSDFDPKRDRSGRDAAQRDWSFAAEIEWSDGDTDVSIGEMEAEA